MNVEQRVFNRLFKEDKTELATQKVDLGFDSDFDKISSNAKSIKSKLSKSEEDGKNAIKMILKSNKDLINVKGLYLNTKKDISKLQKELDKGFNDLYKKSKEIGVDIKDVPAYKSYNEARDMLKDVFDENQNVFNLVSKYL